MRYGSTTRYDWAHDGAPARYDSGSVDIRMIGVSARQTSECRLVGPVSLIDVAAFGALATGVLGINNYQRDTRQYCLVPQKYAQLRKGPTMQNCSLRLPSPNPIADTNKVFNLNAALGAFGFLNNLLGNTMVRVGGKSGFLTCQFLQSALCRFRLPFLKRSSHAPLTVANGFQFRPRVLLPIAIAGNLCDTEVHSKKLSHIGRIWFFHVTRGGEVESTILKQQVRFSLPGSEQGKLTLSSNIGDLQTPASSPDIDQSLIDVPLQNPVIKRYRSGRMKNAFRFLVQLVGVGNLGDATDNQLGSQPELFFDLVVCEFLNGKRLERLSIPRKITDPIAGRISPREGFLKCGVGDLVRYQFYLGRQFHKNIVARNSLNNKGGGASSPCLKAGASAPETS
jgi:hypothetical protein